VKMKAKGMKLCVIYASYDANMSIRLYRNVNSSNW
jgi:hypothetical protein